MVQGIKNTRGLPAPNLVKLAMRHALLVSLVAAAALFACGAESDEACVDAECIEAPAPLCEEGRLLTWASPGSCVSDACAYEVVTVDCPAGCEEGACVEASGEGSGAGSGEGSGL